MKVYKKTLDNQNIQVGEVNNCGFVTLYLPEFSKVVDMPRSYYSKFYVNKKYQTKDGETHDLYVDFLPKNKITQIITLEDSIFLELEDCRVTGFITDYGKAIYYDEYIND